MAMRQQQTDGIPQPRPRPRAQVRPVYEDFRPVSEWKQEEQSEILLVYLPGFAKEQIKVSTEAGNTLRIRGERLVGGNKWNRFDEEFRIPEACTMSGIRAKFEGGTLTITIPKKQINFPRPQVLDPKPETTKTPPPQPTTTTTTTDKLGRVDDKTTAPSPSPSPQESATTTKSDQTKGKDLEEQSPPKSAAAQPKFQDETPPTKATSSSTKIVQQTVERKEEKVPEIEKAIEKKRESSDKGKESIIKPEKVFSDKTVKNDKEEAEGTAAGANKEKARDYSDIPKTKQIADIGGSGGGGGGLNLRRYKQAVKEVVDGQLNDERKLMVNVGVAILVIVALGAYVSYTYGSSRKN